jgi:molybdenum cofactor synthesis domain-containing protein
LDYQVVDRATVPDSISEIQEAIRQLAPISDLILTTGGTGISEMDVTPEAVAPLLEKEIPGLGELMRFRGLEKTEYASLSRSLAGALGQCLILCLPGSPKGAVESLEAVSSVLPHAIQLLKGDTEHD